MFVKDLKIISITHKKFNPAQIGWMYIDAKDIPARLKISKEKLGLSELLYLCTCNRVEIVFIPSKESPQFDLANYIKLLNPLVDSFQLEEIVKKCTVYEKERAVNHIFRVASSLDSMVVGEREIITQVKSAYEICSKAGLTGDSIRLLIKKTIETAKKVYTETSISKNPVSVVSLAFEQLGKHINSFENKKFVVIGAGQTITSFTKMLKKKNAKNVVVFNRSYENAMRIANQFQNGEAHTLDDLNTYTQNFDVLISCTGSDLHLIDSHFLTKNFGVFNSKKILIDLAVPYDIERSVQDLEDVELIGMETLKKLSEANITKREKEVAYCNEIIVEQELEFERLVHERKVERAMQNVPVEVKKIKAIALNEIFAKDLEGLDDSSKVVIDKILAYMEKKYISGPMKMAKDILLDRKVNS